MSKSIDLKEIIMLEMHPNQKKVKYNPYTLTITKGIITSILRMVVESSRILRLTKCCTRRLTDLSLRTYPF